MILIFCTSVLIDKVSNTRDKIYNVIWVNSCIEFGAWKIHKNIFLICIMYQNK